MRTIFILFLILSILSGYGQKGFVPRLYSLSKVPKEKTSNSKNQTPDSKNQTPKNKFQNSNKSPGDPIYYEDFDVVPWGGTSNNGEPVPENAPPGYTLVDNTGNGFHWRWSDIGPRGAYTGECPEPIEPLYSSTGNNGFLMFEADWYNTDDECNLADPYIAHDAYVEYSSLDFSAYEHVYLRFEQFSRFCCEYNSESNSFFEISTNGGSSWISFEVSSTRPNIATSNPDVVELDLSDVAGNESSIMFRFRLSGLSHYHWEIDDVLFFEAPQYEIRLLDIWDDYMQQSDLTCYEVDPKYDFYGGLSITPWYTLFPFVGYRAKVENYGIETRESVIYNVDVYQDGDFLVKHTSNPVNLEPHIFDTLNIDFSNTDESYNPFYSVINDTAWILTGFEPPLDYDRQIDVLHYLTCDNLTGNDDDTIITSLYINDTMMSFANRDVIEGKISPDDWGNMLEGDGFGAVFYLPDPVVYGNTDEYYRVSSMDVYIAGDQQPEATELIESGEFYFIASFQEYDDDTGELKHNPIVNSSPRYISLNDTGKWITIPFEYDGSSEFIYEGGKYVAVLQFYGTYVTDANHTIKIGEDLTHKVSGYYACQLFHYGAWTWGMGVPAITLNMSYVGGVGVESNTIEQVQIYPNPCNKYFTIEAPGSHVIQIVNAIGDVVFSQQINNVATIHTEKFASGVYFVYLSEGNSRSCHRLIVE